MTESAQDHMDRIADETRDWSAKNIADGGVCDFCCTELAGLEGVVTYVTAGPITEQLVGVSADGVGVIDHVSDEYWAACPACDPVVQQGDPQKLAEHVAATANYDRIGVERSPYEVARLTRFYREFYALDPKRTTAPVDEVVPYLNDPSDPRGDA